MIKPQNESKSFVCMLCCIVVVTYTFPIKTFAHFNLFMKNTPWCTKPQFARNSFFFIIFHFIYYTYERNHRRRRRVR